MRYLKTLLVSGLLAALSASACWWTVVDFTGNYIAGLNSWHQHFDGDVECLSCEIVEEPVKYYNIITERHFNLYANGILTSCRLSKMYPVSGMKYVKPETPRSTPSALPAEIVARFRLDEQPETMDEYVEKFLAIGKENA